jgi:beta-glucosidase
MSGRPMIINGILDESSAFISAFLPGTSGGQGIVDAITGRYVFRKNGSADKTNSLSFDWPKSMDQLKNFPYYAADNQIP